ncbi:Protein CBG21998 [Caenorhabditis briggsae]|uniref:Protein CBG21998 n=1 Tax=Caenorhabditis briggsae TaxID=6238 RepID=A8Y1B1_CAEBR|nr:Protein CBG21998 [Caenorhabditis briggsae]CAP38680.1 Protein CBG21998 [Caenorhabditis briggsae]
MAINVRQRLFKFTQNFKTKRMKIFLWCLLSYYILILLTASSENYIKAITFRVLRSLGIMSAERKVYEDHNRYLSSNLAASSRLGNHIFELSALLAMSRKLERIPTFFIQDNWHDLMLQDTDILIPGLVDHFLIINETNLKTESFISKDSPSDSLLFSRHHCDVVMFTAPHSTFGWWMGYFSKGNQVYYTDIRYTNDTAIPQGVLIQDDYFPPHWIPVRYNSRDNATVHETL